MSSRRPFAWPVLYFATVLAVVLVAAAPAAANSLYASLVIDGNTGAEIRARNADSPRYPASLTKIMTLYVLFAQIEAGKVKMTDNIAVSKHAAGQPPSKLGLKPGQTITVDHAIRALITKSANDVAAAVAEHISTTEWQFAKVMTATARGLGMSKTTFRNASGLPDGEQKTTARDMATLGWRMMRDFPEHYKLFRLQSFTWHGQTYSNHNRLLGKYAGTEGIKTGYIRASGYNLVASVRRGEKIAIGVVMGGKSGSSRDAHMRAILDESFSKLAARPTAVPRPKPVLVAVAAPPAAEPAETDASGEAKKAEAKKANARPGVVMLAMVATPPQAREMPLAEPISRAPDLSATPGQQIQPAAARAAVMRAQPLPPTAMSAYQPAPAPAASYAGPEIEVPDPIEQLIAAAMQAPVVAADEPEADVRTGRLIVPEGAGAGAIGDADPGEETAVAAFTPSPEAIEIPEGYQIQVGAYATRSDAQARLERAQETADELLAEAMGFTPSVEKDSGTIFRARFAGLDKQSATRACSALKKKRIDCIVVAQ